MCSPLPSNSSQNHTSSSSDYNTNQFIPLLNTTQNSNYNANLLSQLLSFFFGKEQINKSGKKEKRRREINSGGIGGGGESGEEVLLGGGKSESSELVMEENWNWRGRQIDERTRDLF